MSYQPLFLGLGTAVTGTDSNNNRLRGDTSNLRQGQPVRFVVEGNNMLFGGVVANTFYYIKEIIDSEFFTVSAALDGDVLELLDGEGFMLVRTIQKELAPESLRKIDVMLEEIYAAGIGVQVGIQSVSEDSEPSLGADLDLNSNNIVGVGNIDINGIVTADKFRLPSLTVEERNAILDWQNGDMIYNLTTNKIQGYQNSSWINMDGTTV
jgi:hypothetical protein